MLACHRTGHRAGEPSGLPAVETRQLQTSGTGDAPQAASSCIIWRQRRVGRPVTSLQSRSAAHLAAASHMSRVIDLQAPRRLLDTCPSVWRSDRCRAVDICTSRSPQLRSISAAESLQAIVGLAAQGLCFTASDV